MRVNYSAIEMTSYLIIDWSGFTEGNFTDLFTDYSVIRYPSTGVLIRSPKFFLRTRVRLFLVPDRLVP